MNDWRISVKVSLVIGYWGQENVFFYPSSFIFKIPNFWFSINFNMNIPLVCYEHLSKEPVIQWLSFVHVLQICFSFIFCRESHWGVLIPDPVYCFVRFPYPAYTTYGSNSFFFCNFPCPARLHFLFSRHTNLLSRVMLTHKSAIPRHA